MEILDKNSGLIIKSYINLNSDKTLDEIENEQHIVYLVEFDSDEFTVSAVDLNIDIDTSPLDYYNSIELAMTRAIELTEQRNRYLFIIEKLDSFDDEDTSEVQIELDDQNIDNILDMSRTYKIQFDKLLPALLVDGLLLQERKTYANKYSSIIDIYELEYSFETILENLTEDTLVLNPNGNHLVMIPQA